HQWSMGIALHQNRKITADRTQTLNTFDLGFLFTPKSYLGIGLVVYNISQNPDNEFSDFLKQNQVGVGSNFIYTEHLRVKLDWLSSENGSYENSVISTGFETFYSNWFKLGFGVNQNLTSSLIHYSVGFGFIGPKFNVHYAYVTAKENDLDSSHSIDLAIPF
ncbi:MAG TPA: hypothetical protein PLJ21_06540, partial [Pseudobdellovibrionaceae bacterium]|nr:hypothetical protein [Pseudobdellovibrionaceae bacterium]